MFILPILLTIASFNMVTMCSTKAMAQDPFTLSVIGEKPFKGEAGYYFSLESTPLSQDQFIFVATPLKRAYFINGGEMIHLGYTMTIKGRKGFADYFSGEKYNVVLTIKEESKIKGGVTLYRGLLEMQYGAQKRRFKVHGLHHP